MRARTIRTNAERVDSASWPAPVRPGMIALLLLGAGSLVPTFQASLPLAVARAQAQDRHTAKRRKREQGAGKARIEVLTPTLSADEAYARAQARVHVVMYSAHWCGICAQARSYFTQHGVAFEEHDVEREPAARRRYLALNPAASVPTIAVDELVMRGFSPGAFEKLLDQATRVRLSQPDTSGPKTFEVRWH